MAEHLGPWRPLHPSSLAAVLRSVRSRWWLAGGWAIDAFLGGPSRQHGDTDVLVLRDDHVAIRADLAAWDAHAVDPPGSLRPWSVGEVLPDGVHDVWLRRAPQHPWELQLMIDDTADGDWLFRRDPSIRRPVDSLAARNADLFNCPVLTPEVQLLYKSKTLRPKDSADFTAAAPRLNERQRGWLRSTLASQDPHHPWLPTLHRLDEAP